MRQRGARNVPATNARHAGRRGRRHQRPRRSDAGDRGGGDAEEKQAGDFHLARRRYQPVRELGSASRLRIWRAVPQHFHQHPRRAFFRTGAADREDRAQNRGDSQHVYQGPESLDGRGTHPARRPGQSRRGLSVHGLRCDQAARCARQSPPALHLDQARLGRVHLSGGRLPRLEVWRAGIGRRQAADSHQPSRLDHRPDRRRAQQFAPPRQRPLPPRPPRFRGRCLRSLLRHGDQAHGAEGPLRQRPPGPERNRTLRHASARTTPPAIAPPDRGRRAVREGDLVSLGHARR